jgi:hypothetical protein
VTVSIEGNLATVEFRAPFDLERYELFLRTKKLPESQITFDWQTDSYRLTTPARFAPLLGVGTHHHHGQGLPLAEHLFDYQAWAVKLALEAERFALWLDTGLGKTPVMLEWTRQVLQRTSGKVLIIARSASSASTLAKSRASTATLCRSSASTRAKHSRGGVPRRAKAWPSPTTRSSFPTCCPSSAI